MWGGLWCSSWILAGGLRPPDPPPGGLRPRGPPEVWLSYATVWGLRTGGGLEEDRKRIAGGLEEDWRRTGEGFSWILDRRMDVDGSYLAWLRPSMA